MRACDAKSDQSRNFVHYVFGTMFSTLCVGDGAIERFSRRGVAVVLVDLMSDGFKMSN